MVEPASCGLLAPGCVQPELASGALTRLDVTDLPPIATSGALVRRSGGGKLPEPAAALVTAVREAAHRAGTAQPGRRVQLR